MMSASFDGMGSRAEEIWISFLSSLRPMPVFKRTANREKLLLGFSYERSPLQAANTSPLILYSPKVDIAQKTLGLFWTPSRFKAK
jgi:hypothetical protein